MEIFLEKFKKRAGKITFWFAIISVFFLSANIDVTTLTSWVILKDVLIAFIKNPYVIGLFVVAVYGVWNNNTEKGTKD